MPCNECPFNIKRWHAGVLERISRIIIVCISYFARFYQWLVHFQMNINAFSAYIERINCNR